MSSRQAIERELTLLGSPNVGKTTLIVRFTEQNFLSDYIPTIERKFIHSIQHNNVTYKLTIRDTAGLDTYSIIPGHYITNTHGYILVYSICDRQSFDTIKDIYRRLYDENNGSIPVVLVGNKSDLSDERKISIQEGKQLANEWHAQFYETSAMLGDNVNTIYTSCLNAIDNKRNGYNNSSNKNNANSSLNNTNNQQTPSSTNNNNKTININGINSNTRTTTTTTNQKEKGGCSIS